MLLAANLGGETDTVAAVTGQLAGALYGIRTYVKRANARLSAIDQTLDPTLAALAKRDDESLAAWLERVAMLCLTTADDQCLEDVIVRLATIGQFTPPEPQESAVSWISRTLPLLDMP